MIRGLARLGETSGAFAVGCIKSACETRALHRLVCVTGLLRLLLSFLEPVRNPVARSARLAHGIVRRCCHAGRCRRNGGRLLGGAASFLGSCSLGVRQSLLHGILGNAGQRFARLVAQLSIAFVSSRRQRGFFDLDEVLAISDAVTPETGLPDSAAMAAFAAARRASGVCGAGAGGFTLAASYTSCAPSGTNPALRAASSPWIAASAFAASSASLTRPRPTRRATSSITAVPAALQFAPSLYEASLCSSANTRGKQPEPARCTPVRSTRWR